MMVMMMMMQEHETPLLLTLKIFANEPKNPNSQHVHQLWQAGQNQWHRV